LLWIKARRIFCGQGGFAFYRSLMMTVIVTPETNLQSHSYDITTRDGLALLVRPALAGDEAGLAAFFDRVSAEDRRFRFLAAQDHVSHAQLLPLVQADHFRSESFLAFDAARGLLVASALLASDGKLDTAEIAVSVARDYRGRGVGWALLDVLAREARQRGIRRVISLESRDNHAAIELEREKGFVAEALEGDPTLVVLSRVFR
jgi:ribosomal protein S18 acetylase RimI-like enzyme